jgi:nucleoid DNA-binding protein
MNKQELVAKVAADTGLSKVVAGAAVESLLHGIVQSLKRGQPAAFVGFGTFKTSVRKGRMGRNPRTGAAVKIPTHRVARFAPGKGLRDTLK